MKKIFILFLIVASLTVDAQVNFMGIPVDGFNYEVTPKLKAKGFEFNSEFDCLTGQWNGKDVYLYVVTNHSKVYRVCLIEKNKTNDKSEIINRFNILFNQFNNSDKYRLLHGEKIEQTENISYEMHINNKSYEAAFNQRGEIGFFNLNTIWFKISEYYGDYFLCIYYDNELNAPHGEDL